MTYLIIAAVFILMAVNLKGGLLTALLIAIIYVPDILDVRDQMRVEAKEKKKSAA